MAFQTGIITNSHELVDKIYGFLLSIGWTNVATLKTGENNPYPDGYDFVFHSSGENGIDDIYIRIAAGESDKIPIGDIQHPYTDGYTGFINAFAYQHFPSTGTSPEDGFNELGVYGPSLYVADYTGSDYYGYVDEYNLVKSGESSRFRRLIDLGGLVQTDVGTFDGKRFVYQEVRSGSSYPFRRGDLYSDNYVNRATQSTNSEASNTAPFVRLDDGTERIYMTVNVVNENYQKRWLARFNVNDNTWTIDGIDGPPWGTDGGSFGCQCAGVKRKRQPHNYWMYVFRGASSGGEYPHWAQFNINDEVFSGYNSPNAPWGLGQYTSYKPFCLYVTKEQSGYENDRVYIWEGDNRTGFASIAIDNDGYATGNWATHSSTVENQAGGLKAQCVGKTIIMSGTQNYPQGLYKWELPTGDPTQSGSWELVSNTWFRNELTTGSFIFHVHNHLCNRARVSEFETNTYWLFADLNRLVVVVKNAQSKYEYIYVGRFQPYANPISTTLTEDAYEGATTIKVADHSLFEINEKYMICETTGKNGMYVASDVINYQKLLAPSELFTVVKNSGNGELIISKLRATYYSGSRVGEDPMPITSRVHSIEKGQTFDVINLIDDDGYADPAWQTYKLVPTVSDNFANATDIDERFLGTYLYSIVLLSEGDSFIGKEVRGQLIGVYSCGTSIASEEEVTVGSKTYVAFDIDESGQNQRIVIGPK
jgi:hypothetical protein